jgi:hypothetical protein
MGEGGPGERVLLYSPFTAYLKIADGCRRPCAFCAIPLIKGTAVSRPPEAIAAEARQLAAQGCREIILIAQDTTDYGHDLGLSDGLPDLLDSSRSATRAGMWLQDRWQVGTRGLIEPGLRLDYAGITGEYSFEWQYVVEAEAGTISGRAVGLRGRYRIAGAGK